MRDWVWVTPFGWTQSVHPATDPAWLWLLPPLGLSACSSVWRTCFWRGATSARAGPPTPGPARGGFASPLAAIGAAAPRTRAAHLGAGLRRHRRGLRLHRDLARWVFGKEPDDGCGPRLRSGDHGDAHRRVPRHVAADDGHHRRRRRVQAVAVQFYTRSSSTGSTRWSRGLGPGLRVVPPVALLGPALALCSSAAR